MKNRFKAEIRSFFLKELDKLGFKKVKAVTDLDRFLKIENENKYIIDFQFIDRVQKVEIKPTILLIQQDIYEIYSKITDQPGRPHYILGNNLFLIDSYYHDKEIDFSKGNAKWQIRNNEDLDKIKNAFPIYYTQTISRFFENDSVEIIDKLFNEAPEKNIVLNSMYPTRGNVGLIAAKILGRNNLNELYSIYNKRFSEFPEKVQNERVKLWNYLNSMV